MSVKALQQKSVMVIFTYSPAGLGHLRVTDALYAGLPAGITPVILGSQDSFIRFAHRFTSIHPMARFVFESLQDGPLEYIFTKVYGSFLHNQNRTLFKQMKTIMSQRLVIPETVVVIATHFAMAHQLGAIKKKLMKDLDVRILLIVQVTDDSPQLIWFVPGADMIFVPSEKTKRELEKYRRDEEMDTVPIEVNPYPVSPVLGEHLSPTFFEHRKHQYDPLGSANIHVSVPISGAAVGTEFMSTLMEKLHVRSSRFIFHVITKYAPFTSMFLSDISKHTYVNILTSVHDRMLVDYYIQMYERNVISFEITKPSEQTFKVLFEPRQRGGVILLFASPIGRQEYDNLSFLQRNHFTPSALTHHRLYMAAEDNQILKNDLKRHVEKHAVNWRGLILPKDPTKAADFIFWCHVNGIFEIMKEYNKKNPQHHTLNMQEIGSDGVHTFWQKVAELL